MIEKQFKETEVGTKGLEKKSFGTENSETKSSE